MAEQRQRVILYGDSLILESVRASLEDCPGLEVLLFHQPLGSQLEELRLLCPATVIFDLSSVQPDFPRSLLQQSDLLLIGIDPETHQAHVWSGRQAGAVGAADLIRFIYANFKRNKDSNPK